MKAFPELAAALGEMLDRIDASLRAGGHVDPPVIMYLAGGVAVNFYCGTRYTEDVDASFSQRLVLPRDLTVNYRRSDGSEAFIYFDANCNTSFALLREGFEERAQEWPGLGGGQRLIEVHVLAPLDLAVSKIARFSEQDREDIHALAGEGYFTTGQLRAHALAAMRDYVGDKRPLLTSIDVICRALESSGSS